jgi:GNAT superfamily N-acetyltransferase
MTKAYREYRLSDVREEMDFAAVHSMLTTAYWSKGVARERVERAAGNSALVFGAFHHSQQIAYARVVSDLTTFAWLCDVFVREDHRGKGVGNALIEFIVAHPLLGDLRRWILATRDAHDLYRRHGFNPLEAPEIWMVRGQNSPPPKEG